MRRSTSSSLARINRGLRAALTVAQEGDGLTCLLVEKCPASNGCSAVCGGDSIYDTNLQYLKDMAMTPLGSSIPEDVLEAFYNGITKIRLDFGPRRSEGQTYVCRVPFEGTAEYREFDSQMYCGFGSTAKTNLLTIISSPS